MTSQQLNEWIIAKNAYGYHGIGVGLDPSPQVNGIVVCDRHTNSTGQGHINPTGKGHTTGGTLGGIKPKVDTKKYAVVHKDYVLDYTSPLQNVIIVLAIVLTSIFLCGCNSLNQDLSPAEQEILDNWSLKKVNEVSIAAIELVEEIAEPAIQYYELTPGIGYVNSDFVGSLRYFRDNDFSEQIAELEILHDRISILSTSIPYIDAIRNKRVNAIIDHAIRTRISIETNLKLINELVELGKSYQERDIGELTPDECIILLNVVYLQKN